MDGQHESGLNKLSQTLKLNDGIEGLINNCGYGLLNKDKLNEAILVFKFNADSFPKSANCCDSLAEAYLKNSDKKNAKTYYKKALELDSNLNSAINALKNLK